MASFSLEEYNLLLGKNNMLTNEIVELEEKRNNFLLIKNYKLLKKKYDVLQNKYDVLQTEFNESQIKIKKRCLCWI
jgi:hypothetical protein